MADTSPPGLRRSKVARILPKCFTCVGRLLSFVIDSPGICDGTAADGGQQSAYAGGTTLVHRPMPIPGAGLPGGPRQAKSASACSTL
jgi:hypothetical protein